MKYTYMWLLLLLLGSAGLVIIVMFETITLNNDSEYYILKEAMEAAMLESVDVTCFRLTTNVNENGCNGQLKISEQKFVENFTRRFAASISDDADSYTIDFYDIIEMPPKASVVIKSSNRNFKLVMDEVDISNGLSGILEAGWGEYTLSLENDQTIDDNVTVPDDFDKIPDDSTLNDFEGDANSDEVKDTDPNGGQDGHDIGDDNASISDDEDYTEEDNSINIDEEDTTNYDSG